MLNENWHWILSFCTRTSGENQVQRINSLQKGMLDSQTQCIIPSPTGNEESNGSVSWKVNSNSRKGATQSKSDPKKSIAKLLREERIWNYSSSLSWILGTGEAQVVWVHLIDQANTAFVSPKEQEQTSASAGILNCVLQCLLTILEPANGIHQFPKHYHSHILSL